VEYDTSYPSPIWLGPWIFARHSHSLIESRRIPWTGVAFQAAAIDPFGIWAYPNLTQAARIDGRPVALATMEREGRGSSR
jgi:hypothetical protein